MLSKKCTIILYLMPHACFCVTFRPGTCNCAFDFFGGKHSHSYPRMCVVLCMYVCTLVVAGMAAIAEMLKNM